MSAGGGPGHVAQRIARRGAARTAGLVVGALTLAVALTILSRPATSRAATCVPHPPPVNAFPSSPPVSDQVSAAISVGSLPQQVVIDAADVRGYAYIANSGSDTVSVLSTRAPIDQSISALATLPSGGRIPASIAVDELSGRVYVGNAGSCSIGVIDGRAAGGPTFVAAIPIGLTPTAIDVGPDGRVYVLGSNPDGLLVITPDDGAGATSANASDFPASAPVTTGFAPNRASIAIDPVNRLAFVGGYDVIETVDLSGPLPVVVASAPLTGICLGLAFDLSSGLLYASDNLFDTISWLHPGPDGRSLQVVASVPAAAVIDPGKNVNPVGLVILPLRRELLATSYSTETPPTAELTVFALDPAGGLSILRTITGINHATWMALDPVTGRVLVNEREANRIAVLDLETPSPLDLAFVLPGPFDLSLTPADIARNLGLTLLVVLLIGAPTPLFNSTLEANEEEIRRWLRRRFRLAGRATRLSGLRRRWIGVGIYLAVAALLYAFLDRKFPFDDQVVALGSALVTLVVATSASILPGERYVMTRYHEHGSPRAALWTLGMAAICLLVTRLTGAQPGYIYGIIGGFAFTTALTVADHGRMAFRGGLALLGLGLVAWFLRVPFEPVVGQPQDAGLQLVNKVLEGLFVGSIQGLVFGLVPLRFLTGETLKAWSVPRWLLLWGVGIALFIGVVLYPVSSYEPHPSGTGLLTMAVTVAVYGLVAVGFWGFFRRRKRRAEPATTLPTS